MKSTGHPGALVYDADCAFCTRFAMWSGDALPWQELDLEKTGATIDQVTNAAGWLVDGRIVAWGSEAIASAMVQRGRIAGLFGRALRAPVARVAADLVYRVVARNRHLMPGGTASCRIRPPGPSTPTLLLAMSAILLAGLSSLVATSHGREPYPSLIMPGFPFVPESGGVVHSTEATYTLLQEDGSTRRVSARRLLGEHAGYVAAQRTLATPGAARDPAVGRWLLSNLGSAARGTSGVRVDWHQVAFNTHTRVRRDMGVVFSITFNVGFSDR